MSFLSKFLTAVFVSIFMVPIANASMFGYGMYGGMGACPYGTSAGSDISDAQEDVKEAARDLADAKKDVKELERDKKDLEVEIKDYEKAVKGAMSEGAASAALTHMASRRSCCEYDAFSCSSGGQEIVVLSEVQMKDKDFKADKDDPDRRRGQGKTPGRLSDKEWGKYCDQQNSGQVNPQICSDFQRSSKGEYGASDCVEALNELTDLQAKLGIVKDQLANAKRNVARLNRSFKSNKKALTRAIKDATEGDCPECALQGSGYAYKQKEMSTGQILGNVAMGLGAVALGTYENQQTRQNNAQLGWPSQTYPAIGYGFPFLMAGMYGAMGGGIGTGGFGCAGGMGGGGYGGGPFGMMGPFGMGNMYGQGGGAFGMPPWMMGNPMSGGMYMPGMGPWGMAGPWGNMGGPYGMQGMMASGGGLIGLGMMVPGMMGMMQGQMGAMGMGMMPMQGMGMGMGMMPMQGMGMLGMSAMGMGMMPMQGMGMGMGMMPMQGMGMGLGMMPMQGMAGMGIGGAIGGFMPMGGMGMGMMPMQGMGMGMMPMQGMAGMSAMGMMPMQGMAGMSAMGMMPMQGMAGMSAMGMMPMQGMAGMSAMGMMPMQGMAGMASMGAAGGLGGGLQYQQQLMQMQMQAAQQQMEQQRAAAEQMQARQRIAQGLQTELYTLMMRLQQVQMGGGSLGVGIQGGIQGGYNLQGVGTGTSNLGTTPIR